MTNVQFPMSNDSTQGDVNMTQIPNRPYRSDVRPLVIGHWSLVISSVLFFAGCGRPPAEEKPGGAAPGAEIVSAPLVNVAPAQTRTIQKTMEVTGNLVALQDVLVGAQGGGKLAAVHVQEGDSVNAGQVVAVMDTVDLAAQVQQQQANVQAALTREQQARVVLSQARNALQSARTQLSWTDKTTANAVQQARSGVDLAQQRLAVVKEGARAQERAQAEEQVKGARANHDKARADLKRYQALYREQAVSASQLDEKQAAFDSAQSQLNSALQAQSLMKEGARPEDIRQAEIAVQQAKDTLSRAIADRDTVKLRREDVKNAQTGVESALAGIRNAEAGTAQARAGLRIVQDNLSNAYVKSPISGIVAERRAEPGSQLMQAGEILRIVNPRSVYFQAVVSESQFSQLREGQTATVRIDALPGRAFSGRVTRILPVASAAARSFNVRISIAPDPRLRPQMFARGSVLIDTRRGATVVRKEAVLYDPVTKTARVFISKPNDVAEERKVQTGYTDNGNIEILSGVRPGEKVIVTGQTTLQDGDKVKIEAGVGGQESGVGGQITRRI